MELQVIQNKIYEIRGRKVILDFDLAEMYGIETKVLKQSIKRNLKRFEGADFMFELTKNELFELSRSQIVTLNKGRGSNIKYLPFAFTELGVEHTRHRSTINFFTNLLSGLAAYTFFPKKPAIKVEFIENSNQVALFC